MTDAVQLLFRVRSAYYPNLKYIEEVKARNINSDFLPSEKDKESDFVYQAALSFEDETGA